MKQRKKNKKIMAMIITRVDMSKATFSEKDKPQKNLSDICYKIEDGGGHKANTVKHLILNVQRKLFTHET